MQRIYEKRYGPELKQQTSEAAVNGTPVSATAALLLQAAKEDKERQQRRKHKKARLAHRHKTSSATGAATTTDGYNEDQDATASTAAAAATTQAVDTKPPDKTAAEKLEEARRAVWLDIARKHIPRVSSDILFLFHLFGVGEIIEYLNRTPFVFNFFL